MAKNVFYNTLLPSASGFSMDNIKTVTKAFDNKWNNRENAKWQMKESEEAAAEGEKQKTMFSQANDSPS